MRPLASILISSVALLCSSLLPAQIDVSVYAEDEQVVALGTARRRTIPAGQLLVPAGSQQPWTLAVLDSFRSCLSGAGTLVQVTRDGSPSAWPTPDVSVSSSVQTGGDGMCDARWPDAGEHTVRLEFQSPTPLNGFLWIRGTADSPDAAAAVDVDGDGVFELSGPSFEAWPEVFVDAGQPLQVRVRTRAGLRTRGTAEARVRVQLRVGQPMPAHGLPCQRTPAAAPFTLFAWTEDPFLHLQSDGFPITQAPPVLVIGTTEQAIPLTRAGCLLLTDPYVPLLWSAATVPPIATLQYPPDARGATFFAQWLVAGDVGGGTVDWWTSNATRVTLPR